MSQNGWQQPASGSHSLDAVGSAQRLPGSHELAKLHGSFALPSGPDASSTHRKPVKVGLWMHTSDGSQSWSSGSQASRQIGSVPSLATAHVFSMSAHSGASLVPVHSCTQKPTFM